MGRTIDREVQRTTKLPMSGYIRPRSAEDLHLSRHVQLFPECFGVISPDIIPIFTNIYSRNVPEINTARLKKEGRKPLTAILQETTDKTMIGLLTLF